jgi:hypothetical protein
MLSKHLIHFNFLFFIDKCFRDEDSFYLSEPSVKSEWKWSWVCWFYPMIQMSLVSSVNKFHLTKHDFCEYMGGGDPVYCYMMSYWTIHRYRISRNFSEDLILALLANNSNVVCYSYFDWTKAKFKESLHINKSLNIHTHLKSVTSLNYYSLNILWQ